MKESFSPTQQEQKLRQAMAEVDPNLMEIIEWIISLLPPKKPEPEFIVSYLGTTDAN